MQVCGRFSETQHGGRADPSHPGTIWKFQSACESSWTAGFFKTTVGVHHKCLLSPILFNFRSCPPLWLWDMDLLPDSKKNIQAFKTKHLRKLLCISYLERKTNGCVKRMFNFLLGPQEPLLATVKRWKLTWFGHIMSHDSLSKTILQSTLEGEWCCSWQRKCWMDNIKEWTSLPMPELFTRASCRKD